MIYGGRFTVPCPFILNKKFDFNKKVVSDITSETTFFIKIKLFNINEVLGGRSTVSQQSFLHGQLWVDGY
jgi:hypothetical protein